MAIQRYTIDGYGQIEINNCAFRRDGRIEAQCAPSTTDFSAIPVENGMLVAVDNVTRTVKIPTNASLPIGVVYSEEHMYDDRKPGLKNFKTEAKDDFLPRIGYLAAGDKFTTNCLAYDTATYSNDAAVESALASISATAVYGKFGSLGAITLATAAPTVGPVLKAVQKTTMPDGQLGVKFQVISC